ncbi:EamA family transporter RarD [Maridesulfovibrio bastinii]|uniref:EamA family transporter RarD n=1 Tax=Maridesulfovibrio bastinii TaxID=47157 RepID=UPI0004010D3C|nr:EamA family transporter RarD [Maridesulfovibrio bastinii]
MINSKYHGFLYAAGAFLSWGLLTIYWKQLNNVSALELICHRIVWSFFFVALVITFKKKWTEVMAVKDDKKTSLLLCLSSTLVGTNWFIFIWSVNHNHVVEASLGYYINPLVNALLGFIFMKDKLNRRQMWAIALAAIGVSYSIIDYGKFPWIALSLAFSFGSYGLVRKLMKVESLPGLLIETTILSPLAAAYLIWLYMQGTLSFGAIGMDKNILILLAGAATSIPLIFFAHAARRLKLATLGIFQYITPTCLLLLGVFVYGEPFHQSSLVTFSFIWAGILLYAFDGLSVQRKIYRQTSGQAQ